MGRFFQCRYSTMTTPAVRVPDGPLQPLQEGQYQWAWSDETQKWQWYVFPPRASLGILTEHKHHTHPSLGDSFSPSLLFKSWHGHLRDGHWEELTQKIIGNPILPNSQDCWVQELRSQWYLPVFQDSSGVYLGGAQNYKYVTGPVIGRYYFRYVIFDKSS